MNLASNLAVENEIVLLWGKFNLREKFLSKSHSICLTLWIYRRRSQAKERSFFIVSFRIHQWHDSQTEGISSESWGLGKHSNPGINKEYLHIYFWQTKQLVTVTLQEKKKSELFYHLHKRSRIWRKVNHNISFFNWMLNKNTKKEVTKKMYIYRDNLNNLLSIIRYLSSRLLKISLMIIVPNKNLLKYLGENTSSEVISFYTKIILLIRKVHLLY